ncbi:MAG: twin-arginine translocation signal domain-containing protein [Acidobacteria bacterium]|nr:twin-arginine translocation signal domain-containing protein [Acidobacteriota bacterium]
MKEQAGKNEGAGVPQNGAQSTPQNGPQNGAQNPNDRRDFLKMAAGGAAAAAASMVAQSTLASAQVAAKPAAEPAADATEHAEVLVGERGGADFMTDVLKTLDFEFVASNPGSSFRGLQESLINYGKNVAPEWLTCCHEESSVAMAHGYYKIAGKPMLIFAHGTVGLQHAAMAIYNAYCDRVPVYMILGNSFDAATRRPGAEWYHSVQDCAAMVRDYTKWDDMPVSLTHFAESAVRAYKLAMTPPMGPVAIVADSDLQEKPISPNEKFRIPKLTIPSPPQGDTGAVAEAAKLLVNAEYPVILADRVARTPRGAELLVELAETLQAAVNDGGGRVNFPSRHPLASGGNVRNADVILALEHSDIWGATNSMRDQLHRSASSNTKAGVKVITISASDLYIKSNYQDFQRMREVDIAMAADAEATLPALIEAVKKLITPDRRIFFEARGKKIAEANRLAAERTKQEAALAWDSSPISTARLAAEVWQQIKTKDWSLVGGGGWAKRLWDFNKPYHHNGGSGGAGVGYSSPAAVGAALANKKYGRLSINIQNDGDMMYAPGVLWTAAHHKIPMLNIMNNNRAYHQEVMHLQRMANRYDREITNASIGNEIANPNIDYAKLAQSMGWYAEGPITDPKEIGPALKRAIAVVEKGQPALIDTVVQPR